MSKNYERPVTTERKPWGRRIEAYSPKLGRRIILFSPEAHDAWLLLEADPAVKRFCERPAYFEGESGRFIDFWVSQGRSAHFWLVETEGESRHEWPARVDGLRLNVIRREDLLAQSVTIANWSKIVPYLTSFARYSSKELQRDVLQRLQKPQKLMRLEDAFHPIDAQSVRAAVFALLAAGKVMAPELTLTPLEQTTVFRRN